MDPTQVAGQASSLVGTLASHGVLGIVTALSLLFAWNKDRELKAEREARIDDTRTHSDALKAEQAARIADAKGYNDLALKLQERVIDAINKLGDILEQLKEQRQQPTLGNPLGKR